VEAREDPDFLIIARSDAFWVSGDLEDTIARLQLYAEAGMVFQTLVGPAELAAVRRRVAKPAMIVLQDRWHAARRHERAGKVARLRRLCRARASTAKASAR
jgi:methylisocitrate lyase